MIRQRTHPSPLQILAKLLPRPLFPPIPQNIHRLMVQILNTLPNRRLELTRGRTPRKRDQRRRELGRCRCGAGGFRWWDGIDDGWWVGVVGCVAESGSPDVVANALVPVNVIGRGRTSGKSRN